MLGAQNSDSPLKLNTSQSPIIFDTMSTLLESVHAASNCSEETTSLMAAAKERYNVLSKSQVD